MAFQLSDDLLDIASESAQSGKTPGTDLREGVPTLPVLYALAGDDSDAASVRLREILATGPLDRRRAARRGARPAAGVPRAQAGPGDRPQLRRGRPRAAGPAARTARPAGRSNPSATSSPTAPADPAPSPPGGTGVGHPGAAGEHERRRPRTSMAVAAASHIAG